MTAGLPKNLSDTVADEVRALALVYPYPFDFYVSFFTTHFLPPHRDVANDAQHGIAPGSDYTIPSRNG